MRKGWLLVICGLVGAAGAILSLGAAAGAPRYDVIIRGGTVYDGTGAPGRRADVGIRGDRIAVVGDLSAATAAQEVEARGQAVAPGFINMLSWAPDALMVDGRSSSDLKQGVTLEIFGEGWSMGPFSDWSRDYSKSLQGDIQYDITWTTLGEFLDQLVARGLTTNVASFVGATTLRMHEMKYDNRPPTPVELQRMQQLTREAMAEGALGVGASLIYAPAFYAKTDELTALAKAAGETGGGYVAHMRSEANRLLEAIDETVAIGRDAGVHAEIYHLKAAGKVNWSKFPQAIARIEAARAAGLSVSANMYTYPAAATGLDASMPPWVQEGGIDQWVARLKDPTTRARVIKEMKTPTDAWENIGLLAGSPENIRFIGFKSEALKPLTGKTLAEVAAMRGTPPEETMIDLVVEDHSRVDTAYFLMSEDNVRLAIKQPWVAFGSDAESSAPEGVFLKSSTHPRAYGNVARLLGRYVRDEKLIPLEDAVRRLTRLPAQNWKLRDRGCFDAGCYADVVVFDPATIQDHATFDKPMQFATGMKQVFVNGAQVLKDGEVTSARSGRVVRGPGWCGWQAGGCGAAAGKSAAGGAGATAAATAAGGASNAPAGPGGVAMQWSVRIPMRDGVNLNATLYRARGASAPTPCIFTLTPYISQSYHERGTWFASHGYAFLTVDVRGRGNSEGRYDPLLQEARDGYDIVEWLAKQPFCDGKVTMWGGSYAGYDQWATAKEFPAHLATIVPVAAPYAGVDFPMQDMLFGPYDLQWLNFTAGRTGQPAIFGDQEFWGGVFKTLYLEHRPFRELDTLAGMPSEIFQRWIAHPKQDAFWDAYNPTSEQYARMTLPILSITGQYDGDQEGALAHYRASMKNASPAARLRHYLVIGPWNHAGTRTPQAEFDGLSFGPASLVDMNALHKAWYDWTMKSGSKPEFLKAPVMYYVAGEGAEDWRQADTLEAITTGRRVLHLDSAGGRANDLFASGSLGASPGKGGPDRYTYDPLDTSFAWAADPPFVDSYTDQRAEYLNRGGSLIYHSAPFTGATMIAGFFRLSAFIALDQPDTDLSVSVYDIAPDGRSIFLTGDSMRARFRQGRRAEHLATPGKVERYDFDTFPFVARIIPAGHRLRLTIGPINSPFAQKNYNAGGVVSAESGKDARTVIVTLHHDASRPSSLEVPIGR
ncbi:MAG TPA: CocE/NonD family hydrolase [Dongiaceae bacterium]|nr:CocE/NonD family hydrolase [Dongiaceae bacterium]